MTLADSSPKRLQAYGQWRKVYEEASSRRDDLTGGYFAMSMVGSCSRKLAYYYLNYPTAELSARSMRVFEHGCLFEDWVKYTLTRYGPEYGISYDSAERKLLRNNPPCVGHIDGIIYADNPRQVEACLNQEKYDGNREQSKHNMEIKTCAQIRFYDIVGGKDVYRRKFIKGWGSIEAAPDWYNQDIFYLGHLMQEEPAIKDTFLIMESKNTSHLDISRITFNPKRFNELEEKLAYIWLTVQNGELPDREAGYNKGKLGYPCTWTDGGCGYLEECKPPKEKK